MAPYLYKAGLEKLAQEVAGTENIHIGIRPYGFHAGNALALIVYPYLLCQYVTDRGITPRFNFYVSINDYEQDQLAGPDPIKYPFNTHPTYTSIQHLPDELGCCHSLTDHWEPPIQRALLFLSHAYPNLTIRTIRNSSLKTHPVFYDLFQKTIADPTVLAHIFRTYSEKEVLDSPLSYGGAICPNCYSAAGDTRVRDHQTEWACFSCNLHTKQSFTDYDYWWYHKPMLLARLAILGITITISGGDHFSEGDFLIRRAIIQHYLPTLPEPKMLFTPLLLALDGRKMSKSRCNTAAADINHLIHYAAHNYGNELQIRPPDLLTQETHS